MAVDKNSKAYQSLQKSGYSDEQISQMHQQVAQGNTPQSVVSGNPRPQTPMVDPIAYRSENNTGRYDKYIEGWDPRKLNNADVNLSQY
jgi:hypothetical protein